jgi:predicted DNA-binding ribbon-helix-helix protein
VQKRSIVIAGRKTSVSLEDPFWNGLREIAARQKLTVPALVQSIDQDRQHSNLSSAVRMFVLRHYQEMADAQDRAQTNAGRTVLVALAAHDGESDGGSKTEILAARNGAP